MAIQIKELLPADSLSSAVDKINYNFDQLILAGGGPEGPQGPQGIIGPAGPKGDRGSNWFVNTVSGTVGTTLPSSIFDQDMILDDDGFVWEYNGTNWFNTGVNLTGPPGPAGNDGVAGEYLRYPGISTGLDFVVQPGGVTGPISYGNTQPNFFGYYNNTDANVQGIDSYIFGHNEDVALSKGLGAFNSIPKMIILQSNTYDGLSIGLGSTYSAALPLGQVDFSKHAKIYKDVSNALRIEGSRGATGADAFVFVGSTTKKAKIEILGHNESAVKVGTDFGSTWGDNIMIETDGISVIRGNKTPSTNVEASGWFGTAADDNFDKTTTTGNDVVIRAKFDSGSDTYGKFIVKSAQESIFAGDDTQSNVSIKLVGKTNSVSNRSKYLRILSGSNGYHDITSYNNTIGGYIRVDAGALYLQSKGLWRTIVGSDPYGFFGAPTYRLLGVYSGSATIDTHVEIGNKGDRRAQLIHRSNRVIGSRTFGDTFSIAVELDALTGTPDDNRADGAALTFQHSNSHVNYVSSGSKRGPSNIIGMGGFVPQQWTAQQKDRLNVFGGISLKGSSINYGNAGSSNNGFNFKIHHANIGYLQRDMLFVNRYDTSAGDFGPDYGSVEKRSLIYFGTPTARPANMGNSSGPATDALGMGKYTTNYNNDWDLSGFVNFYNQRIRTASDITSITDSAGNMNDRYNYRPGIVLWTNNGETPIKAFHMITGWSSNSNLSPAHSDYILGGEWQSVGSNHGYFGPATGNEYHINAKRAHLSITSDNLAQLRGKTGVRISTGGSEAGDIGMYASRIIRIESESAAQVRSMNSNVTLLASDGRVYNLATDGVFLKHPGNSTTIPIYNFGTVHVRKDAGEGRGGVLYHTPSLGILVDQPRTGTVQEFAIMDASNGFAPWTTSQNTNGGVNHRGKVRGNWHMWDNEFVRRLPKTVDNTADTNPLHWSLNWQENGGGSNSLKLIPQIDTDGVQNGNFNVSFQTFVGSGTTTASAYTVGGWNLARANYDRIIYYTAGSNNPNEYMALDFWLTPPGGVVKSADAGANNNDSVLVQRGGWDNRTDSGLSPYQQGKSIIVPAGWTLTLGYFALGNGTTSQTNTFTMIFNQIKLGVTNVSTPYTNKFDNNKDVLFEDAVGGGAIGDIGDGPIQASEGNIRTITRDIDAGA